jgi:hypothetical protein
MTKLIAALIVIVVLYGGWHLFLYWEKVEKQEENVRKDEAAAAVVGEQLGGVPQKLEASLQAAQRQGANGLREWLKTYGASIQDPRKAWIELDYCTEVAREDPSEAKRIFAQVKARTRPSSPVYPRIQKLQKTYE